MRIILFFFGKEEQLQITTGAKQYTYYTWREQGREQILLEVRRDRKCARERQREHQSVKCGLQEFRN